MAFVLGFDNDIFISYAHVDNTEEWVDNFEKRLANRLQQFDRNAGITIWRDQKLGGSDIFSDKIYKQIKASALLISILSPNGLDSNWCQQERQRFEKAAPSTGGFRLSDDRIRGIKVVKTPLSDDRHREVFGTLGYEFYRRSQTGRFTEFDPTSADFRGKLDELAQEVWDLLNHLRDRALAPPRDLSVYLSTATTDLSGWRETAARQLVAWNCRVLPEAALPTASPAMRNLIEESVSQCVLSIHFAGLKPGFIAEGEGQPVDVLQLDRARAKGVDRMIYQAPAIHPLMQEMLKEKQGLGFEECLKPATVDVLLQSLEDRIKALRSAPPSSSSSLPTVYVVCAPGEWDEAMQLKTCIEAGRRYAALLPICKVDDERVRLRQHREDLRTSDAVLLYWGRAGEAWFRDQFRELIGARKKRRRTLLPALCLSSPPDSNREQYRRPDIHFEQVADLQCNGVRRLFSHLEPPGK